MAYSRRTPNYNLPQYENNDKPSYLQDFNGAMLSIDNALKSNSDNIGNLSNLTTTDKSSLVGAINEVASSPAGTTDYSDLSNKPSINSVTLSGNKTNSDLGIQDALVSGTNIKSINNTSLLGSGNINVGGVEIIDVNDNSGSNPLLLDNLDVGEYILKFDNTSSYLTTKVIYIKNKSTDSAIENITIVTGATLKIIKKMKDMTNNNDCMGEITQLYNSLQGYYTIYLYLIRKDSSNNIVITKQGNRYIPSTSTDGLGNQILRTNVNGTPMWGAMTGIGANYNSSAIQYLKNVNGSLNWVTEANVTPSMLYLGKINAYNSTTNALDLSSYPAGTRIVLKNNDSSRSFYLKVGSNTAQVTVTTANDEAILNNTYYIDINSISGDTASVAVIWASTYMWCPLVTNTISVSFTSGGATVGSITRNMQILPYFQIEEDVSGNLSATTLQQFINVREVGITKTKAQQRTAIQYIDKDKNNFLLTYKSHTSGAQQIFEGTGILKESSTNGLYEAYRITLEINYSGMTYANYQVTKTSLGYVFNPTAITGYSATGTRQLQLNNGVLEWV